MTAKTLRRPVTGVSLIEALVALAVMAFGMMALLGVQTTLRYNNDVARQVTEATRLASEEIEQIRFFNDVLPIAGQANPSWQELDTTASRDVTLPGDTSNTSYALTRTVNAPANTMHKVVRVVVRWTDRSAQNRSVTLDSVVGSLQPLLSGMLSVPPRAGAQALRVGRHQTIPSQAVEIPGGTSAFKPSPGDDVVWRFDNLTGTVKSVCTGVTVNQAAITLADLSSCVAVAGRLVSGTVRFHGGTGVTSADALAPAGPALPLHASIPLVFLNELGFNSPVNQSGTPKCYANSPTSAVLASARSAVTYACLIYLTDSSQGWGGKLDLSLVATYANGDTVPGGTSAYKVCRYTKSSRQYTVNVDHPRTYCRTADADTCNQRVIGSLSNQNFLVIRSTESCPAATAGATDLVNPNTLPHQP